jgi:1-deoxy-D-xylulose-5-phosphate reductoisomerase
VTTNLAVLGSTGSIGTQTIEVVRAESDQYRISAIGAGSSVELLAAQAREFRPDVVAIADDSKAHELAALVPAGTEVVAGPSALADVAPSADVVVNGVVGFAGLGVTLATLRAGKRLALANKESLISAGPVVQPLRSIPGAELIPVDSEHCAIHQCLRAALGEPDGTTKGVRKVVLTASGGPFRGRSAAELSEVTVAEALQHPTWAMGPKITIDSSTLMNKGLEVIEAHELFGVDYDQIVVVVHPQSIIHSMVEFTDGATIAQLSLPDMRLPIGYALAYPDRITTPFGSINWAELGRLDFEAPDMTTFTCLGLAFEAGRIGGTAPAWLNAANEVVVDRFLQARIPWRSIGETLTEMLARHDGTPADSAEAVIELDARARAKTIEFLDTVA